MSNLLNLRNLREFNPQRAAGTAKRETAKRGSATDKRTKYS